MMVDIEMGIVSPQPAKLGKASEKHIWMQDCALGYCENVGMPQRCSHSLLKGLRAAFSAGSGPEADDKIEAVSL